MLEAPWTTWLFVRIWPSDVRIMPVPAPRGRRPSAPRTCAEVLMSTTDPFVAAGKDPVSVRGPPRPPVEGDGLDPTLIPISVPASSIAANNATRPAAQPLRRGGIAGRAG